MATNTEKIVVQVVVQGDKQLDKLDKKAGKTTKSFGKMAAGIFGAVTAFRKVAQVAADAIKTFSAFEFQMAKVRATTGASNKDFKKLTATAQQLGRTTFFTATQVGELQMNFAKLGFTTSEILDAQEATLRLATATGSDLARAAMVAGASVRGFGLDANETERVVDVMAVAFTSSALDIERWQTSMTKIAPIAAGANISIESSAAVMGKLSDAGIEASIAGTSLRNIFLKMQDSSSDLSQHLGFTVNSSEDLERALLQLNSEGLTNEEIMRLVDLRQVAAFATMVRGTENIIGMTDALEDANGEAQKMADIMADTLEGDLITAKSAWEGLTLSIFTGNSKISKALRSVVNAFTVTSNQISDSLKSTEQISADLFTNTTKIAKEETKKLNKERGEASTTYSQQLKQEVASLRNTLTMKEFYVNNSLLKIKKLTEEGQKGAYQANAQDIAEEQKKYEERLKIFNATKIALKDLTEEVETQNKKETSLSDAAAVEAAVAAEQERRNEEIAADKLEEKRQKKLREQQIADKKAFQDKKNAISIEYQELENIHKQALIDGEITQETYDEAAFDMEQQRLEDTKNLLIKYGEDTSVINGQILENELKMIDDKAAAEEAAIDKSQEEKNKAFAEDIKRAAMSGESAEDAAKRLIRAKIMETVATYIVGAFSANPLLGAIVAAGAGSLVSGVFERAFSNITFANGGMIEEFANGGMVHGKSHAQGGEKFAVGGRVVELEGGEAVINKRSTAMFGRQLSAMNAAGGGVKFADGGLLNQPSFSQQQFNALGQSQMMGAMGGASKVVVVEADITSSQNTVSVIQSQATI